MSAASTLSGAGGGGPPVLVGTGGVRVYSTALLDLVTSGSVDDHGSDLGSATGQTPSGTGSAAGSPKRSSRSFMSPTSKDRRSSKGAGGRGHTGRSSQQRQPQISVSVPTLQMPPTLAGGAASAASLGAASAAPRAAGGSASEAPSGAHRGRRSSMAMALEAPVIKEIDTGDVSLTVPGSALHCEGECTACESGGAATPVGALFVLCMVYASVCVWARGAAATVTQLATQRLHAHTAFDSLFAILVLLGPHQHHHTTVTTCRYCHHALHDTMTTSTSTAQAHREAAARPRVPRADAHHV